MIQLFLNKTEYFNDICDEIRLFFPMERIREETEFTDEEPSKTITVNIQTDLINKCTYSTALTEGILCEKTAVLNQFDLIYVKRIEKRNAKICVFELLSKITKVSIPWGSLTGIRPTKLYRTIMQQQGFTAAEDSFRNMFSVSEQKIEVAKHIVKNQMPYIDTVTENSIDIYIHIPFCNSKCLYCSFPSEIIRSSDNEHLVDYIEYLKKDILHGFRIVQEGNYNVRNIYIGGGTPSVLSAAQLDTVLTLLNDLYYKDEMEFTVEAGRPDSLDEEKLKVMREHNVNRISINPQTMQNDTLVRLGRLHTPKDIVSVFETAHKIGFRTINMDLIAGLPGETVEDFNNTLSTVCNLSPENLTIHTLAIKRSSKLHQFLESYQLPEENTVIQMVENGYSTAITNDYQPYYMYRQKYMAGNLENIGYSKKGHICIYNIDMMEETTNILAHGANAMSKRVFPTESRVERIPNPKDLKTYIEKLSIINESKRKLFIDSIKH